jgi:hypothetical protein
MTNAKKSAIYGTGAAIWLGVMMWLTGNRNPADLFFLCSLVFAIVFIGAKCALDTLFRNE